MKKYYLHTVIFTFYALAIHAQVPVTTPAFSIFESSLKVQFDSLKGETSDSVKLATMDSIQQKLAKFLENPATYTFPFDSLKHIGKIKSPDDAFRIFTWNIFLEIDSFKNFCLIQLKPEKEKPCPIFILHDQSNIDQAGNKTLTAENWYGAMYYKIIPQKIHSKHYYTLLGLDSYSPYISKKVIDVLYFENDQPLFGAPVFYISGKPIYRKVFSFSARISMMLNYDEILKMIVFDHLSPSETRYTGQFEYYGPDFSFDGFQFIKNQWQFVEDVKPNRPARKRK